ncbi:MAG: iron-sulfur cluster assembly accessory protein [Chlamydiales bacterium]
MTAKQEEKITRDMTIGEIFSKHPHKSQHLAQAMTRAGLHCSNCSAATWETLEAGILGHGMSEEELEKLIDELNLILDEEIDMTKISLTPKAAQKFKEFAEEDGKAGWGLRFGDSAGGCGGFQYELDFEKNSAPEDKVFESEGIKIYVKKGMVERLIGSVIDYVDGLQDAGFKISNPNVKSSCGCGHSQGY